MEETKQPQLNGAYYGPSIPPPSKSYHRPGRGGGGCGICSCLCGCIFNLICQIIIALVVIIGIAVLVLWLVFQPNNVKFYVTDARLSQFQQSTTNSTLYYNLSLNMTIRNPNRRIGIYYDRLEARAEYEGHRFGYTELTRFYQGHKTTSYVNPVFQGQQMFLLDGNQLNMYNEETTSGVYSIRVRLNMRIRLRVGVFRIPRMRPNIECDLRIPLNTNGRLSGIVLDTTRCDFDWR